MQLEQTQDLSSVDLQGLLLTMRQQRLGLVQTADQLRFSYIAILQGALQDMELEPSNYDDLVVADDEKEEGEDEEEEEEEEEVEESDSELLCSMDSASLARAWFSSKLEVTVVRSRMGKV